MKGSIHKQRIKLYLWIGLGYLLFWWFIDFTRGWEAFAQKAINNIWLVGYLVVVNYILFEFTIPFIRLKWKRVLATPFLLFAHLMLYSFGMYAWRSIGIGIGI